MLYIWIVFGLMEGVFFVLSLCVLYHALAFGFKGDKSRLVGWSYMIFAITTIVLSSVALYFMRGAFEGLFF